MAKFFKEDLDRKKQSLIADLQNLGKDTDDGFLKGFPKTPAELAAEEAAAKEKVEAEVRAAKEAVRIAEEEDQKAIREAEEEAAVRAAAKLQSGSVKTPKETLKTEKIGFMDFFWALENLLKDFFFSFGRAMMRLAYCVKCEVEFAGINIQAFLRAIKNVVRQKISVYYTENPEKRWARHQKNRKLMRQFIQAKNNFIAKEKAAAARMVRFINHMDDKNEELADKTTVIVTEGNKKFLFAREWAEINKRKLLVQLAVIVICAICGVGVFNYCTAFEYSYNGRTLGMVKKQEDVLKIVDIVSQQLSKEHNAEIYINKDQDITFKRVSALNKEIDSTEDVLNRLTYMKNMSAKAYGIYVNDARIAIVDNKDTADRILEYVKDLYLATTSDVAYESVDFKEDIKLKQIDTKLGRIQNVDDVIQKLLTGAVYQQTHVVAAGDTLSGIAKAYNMTINELKDANQNINPERLSIGQEIILSKPAPMVTIETVEVANYLEAIPYETEYKDTESLYKGENSTKVEGVNGERSVTARITRENGVQVNSVVLGTEVISNPTTAVIIRGTKELPPLQGTGNLRYPVSGYRLTSKFGSRWGRMHYGLDLACPTGTRIGAADGGTVIHSGYSGSYGYVVKIDHGGGIVTVYAHCSKLLVKKGEKVYQGQHIANVGNTGRSTGPHCHFEVQVNGVAKNPMNYL